MCLILLKYQKQIGTPLTVLANRDEAYGRPTMAPHFWADAPYMWAGKDLKSGGTWLGVNKSGAFAAITNCHTAKTTPQASRGHLVRDFLLSNASPKEFAYHTQRHKYLYAGFSLLIGRFGHGASSLYYVSNGGDKMRTLTPGIYALGNRGLDSNEPRNRTLAKAFGADETPQKQQLFDLMAHDLGGPPSHRHKDAFLQYIYTSPFVRTASYGTRNTTMVQMGHISAKLTSLEHHRDGWRGPMTDTQIRYWR